MLHCMLLCWSAFILTAWGVGPVEGEGGQLVEPASLAERLRGHLEPLEEQRGKCGKLSASPETVGEVKAALDFVVGRFLEFFEDYDACEGLLEWRNLVMFESPGSIFAKDYAKLDQDPRFLCPLGEAYFDTLGWMGEILGLWRRNKLGSLDALARFLGAGIEALRINGILEIYHEGILWKRPELLQCFHKDATESDQGAEEARRAFCAKHEEWAKVTTDLVEDMIAELENIIDGLGEAQRAEPYKLFQQYLIWCFNSGGTLSNSLKASESGVTISGQKMPSEIQDWMNVRIFWRLLRFKCKFPNLDHESRESTSVLFPKLYLVPITNDRPPLIRKDTPEWTVLTNLLQSPEGFSKWYYEVNLRLGYLSCWTWSLYQKLRPGGDQSVSHKQAKQWLSDVEDNLCMVLDAIDFADRRKALCALARLMYMGLERVVALVEGIWGILHVAGEQGGPGNLLIRLEQAVGDVLKEGPVLENAVDTRKSGEECERQQGNDCCQQGDNNWVQRASDLARTRAFRYTVVALWLAVVAAPLAQCVRKAQ